LENFNPGTLFIGQESHFLKETHSTNEWMNLHLKSGHLLEGYLVHADYQDKGKGRMLRTWYSDEGKNLLTSILLRPTALKISQQSILSFLTALAVADTISHFIQEEVFVKWPNDVIYHDRKIAGILIENQLKGNYIDRAIIGIGLNVNQPHFPDDIPGISMIQLTGKIYPRKEVLETLCRKLEARYLQWRKSETDLLMHEYNRKLYGRNREVAIHQDQEITKGHIQSVDEDGCIRIVTNDTVNRYHFNSVKLYYHGFNS
jgi:BirA family biotin operon repressor/biotin-[acetyl-CoA-carboxylase] ligase